MSGDRAEEEGKRERGRAWFNCVWRERSLCGGRPLDHSLVATLGMHLPTRLSCHLLRFLPPLMADAMAHGRHWIPTVAHSTPRSQEAKPAR